MRFDQHSDIRDKHAILSPSYSHWVSYDENKLEARFYSFSSARRGTDLHELAKEAIRLRVFLHDEENDSLALYVNDAIRLGLTPEQALYYSPNCFGHADAIGLLEHLSRPRLHVHDLKTGATPAKPMQLKIYSGIFCLEYSFDPFDLDFECRIYQSGRCDVYQPSSDEIAEVMQSIVDKDQQIERLKEAQL